jgi:oligopeptidase B
MHRFLIACVPALLAASACSEVTLTPPMPDKRPTELSMHGHVRIDDYFWLNERDNPEVLGYLEEENGYTAKVMAHTTDLQEKLFQELKSRTQPEQESVPYKYGDYYYYERYEKGREYPIYYRKKGSLDGDEEILLDVNKVAEGYDYYDVEEFEPSPDHKYAAFPVDTVGRRFYTLHFVDLDTGVLLADSIPDITENFEWAGDGRTVFYVKQDPETLRWDRVYRHEIGSASHELVYEERDDTFYVYVSKALSERFLYITTESTDQSEEYFLDANKPDEAPTLFLAREEKHEYAVTDGDDRFYIVTNDNAENFKLMETPIDRTSKENWAVVVPHRDDVLLETVTVFKDHIVVEETHNGLAKIATIDRHGGERRMVKFDEAVYTVSGDDNYEYIATNFRFVYESMTTPPSTYDIDLSTHEKTLLREEEVLGGFDKNNYASERLFAPARDGKKVPISLVYRKGMARNGNNPLLQYGYGSYGDTIYPEFDDEVLSLLDRGFIYAIAHVRGGEELGRRWYFDGRGLNKKNTFTDFIDCTSFLIEQGYTSPAYVFATGSSAGGLLMGAIANMAPDLYKGVDIGVAFVDVVTTMLDPDIPLVTSEYDEWGDPNQKIHYDYMLSYSPYDQIEARDYPNIIATTGLHDSQVQYWEPAKWVAKLRANKTDDNRLLLHTDMRAGHSGRTGRYQPLRETALIYAFFLDLVGITE